MNTAIGDNGEILNLNCTDTKEAEERIEKWTQAMSITITKQNMNAENAEKFIIRTLLGDVKDWYENLTITAKGRLRADTALKTLSNIEVAIRAEFGKLGIETEVNRMNRKRESARAKLMQLSICDMRYDNLKAYICEFKDYFYKAAYEDNERDSILDMFYTKLPDPWGFQILDRYNTTEKGKIVLDSIGSRITYLWESITDRCETDRLNKQAKRLQKSIKLDCKYFEVGRYGCDNYKRKKYKKQKRYIPIKRRYKPNKFMKYYRPKNKIKRNKSTCKCYNCGEAGHISPNCKKPKKANKIINNIECIEFNGEEEQYEFEINEDDTIYIEQFNNTDEEYDDLDQHDIDYWYDSDYNEINMFQEEQIIIRNEEEERPNKIIFNGEKFRKILEQDLDMTRKDIFKNKEISQIFGKRNTEYYVLTDIEHPIDIKYIQNKENKVNLPLYNQKIFENEIEKIPDKDKNKIRNIHLAAVEIIIKGYFREGIDTPLEIMLCDDRITYPNNGSIIATLVGNLIYQQVKFKKLINYSISVQDKNIERSLVMYWNLDGIKMIENSKIFSIRLRNLYVLSDKHIVKNKKHYKENIIIEPLSREVLQNNDKKYIEYEKPELKQELMKSYSKRFEHLPSTSNGNSNIIIDIPQVRNKQNRKQFHIKGKINNNSYPILIDTGAARSYISSSIIKKEKIEQKSIATINSKNYNNENKSYKKESIIKIDILDNIGQQHKIEIIGLIDTIELLEQEEEQVLLGIDTLEQFKPYSITSDYLEINIGYKPIKIKRERKDIYELSKECKNE